VELNLHAHLSSALQLKVAGQLRAPAVLPTEKFLSKHLIGFLGSEEKKNISYA
jgi:hypothetical protein